MFPVYVYHAVEHTNVDVYQSDRQLYLQSNPLNHRVLRRFELENYLYDKEVLKKYCAANELVFNEPAYDAYVTDIVNQNIKDETGRIKNFCGISTSVNPEVFKKQLAKYVDSSISVYAELEQEIFHRK